MAGDDTPRPINDSELLGRLRKVNKRLSLSLAALADGHAEAVDDVASQLRILLGNNNEGNKLIRRVKIAHGLSWPQLFVGPPADDASDVYLSVGCIPTRFIGAADSEEDGQWTRLDQWVNQLAVVVDHGRGQRKLKWERLIDTYANVYGSHISREIPKILDAMSRLHSARLDLGEYMIHCAGLGVAYALGQMLDEAKGKLVVRAERTGVRPLTPLYGLTLRGPHGEGEQFRIDDGGIAGDTTEEVEVIRLHTRHGYWERIFMDASPAGLAAPRINYDMRDAKPEWWPDHTEDDPA